MSGREENEIVKKGRERGAIFFKEDLVFLTFYATILSS
jgi:hypothetical protein